MVVTRVNYFGHDCTYWLKIFPKFYFAAGLQIALVELKRQHPDSYKLSHPRAYSLGQIASKKDNVERFLMGRQVWNLGYLSLLPRLKSFVYDVFILRKEVDPRNVDWDIISDPTRYNLFIVLILSHPTPRVLSIHRLLCQLRFSRNPTVVNTLPRALSRPKVLAYSDTSNYITWCKLLLMIYKYIFLSMFFRFSLCSLCFSLQNWPL